MLSVWLPLNGDLRNQGLSNITAINNGATVDNNGKIGKCYSFDGNDDFINLGDIGSYFDGSAFSICFWIYSLENKTRAVVFSSYGLSSTSNFFGLELNSSNNNYCNNNLRFDWLGSDTYSPDDFVTYDAWTHICVTYDGVNQIKMYKNGTLIQTSTRVLNAIPVGNTYYLGRDSRTGSTAFNGKLNDFRIYDHCLSPRECKQVSAALVLHYPLNWGGFGGENLLANTDFGGVSKKYTLMSGTEGGFSFPPTSWERNIEYTVSCRLRGNANMNLYLISSSGNQALSWVNRGDLSTTDYRFFSITFTSRSDRDVSNLYICTRYGTSNSSVGDWFEIATNSLKLEKGSTATPWTPAPSDDLYSQMGLDNNIEYDVSGYGNNGTRVGTLNWSGDTPRYGTSTVFSGNQHIVEPNEIITTDSTIALWVKSSLNGNGFVLDARNNSGIGKQPIYQYTDGHIQTGGNTKYVTSNSGLLVANTWVHVVLVQNGNSILIYKNGDLFQTISCENSPVIKPTLGARYTFSGGYTGQLSDFRIYATALSPEDVRDLYAVGASLSDTGVLFSNEVSEV